jgi:hypothetical protein
LNGAVFLAFHDGIAWWLHEREHVLFLVPGEHVHAQPILKLKLQARAFQLEPLAFDRFHVRLAVIAFLEFILARKVDRLPIEKAEEHVAFARPVQQKRAGQGEVFAAIAAIAFIFMSPC